MINTRMSMATRLSDHVSRMFMNRSPVYNGVLARFASTSTATTSPTNPTPPPPTRGFQAHKSIYNRAPAKSGPPADGKQTVGYVLHGKFTNNNTMLTLTRRYVRVGKLAEKLTDQEKIIDQVRPMQEVLGTISSGQLGFRGSKKNSYEASFQTTSRMFKLMEEKGYLNERLEIVFRQFGEGREAFLNVLNGKEGTKIRPIIYRVTDASKIRFGGDRPPGRRRV
ncbi:mitochondrial 37S ribosomal protein YmS18 [Sugiyamaella lignohabitans]|uniref:Mitochondrial 37S ribosomal protein YmS18 n=1 Tax=Sugiyamaella lignohabitans TaxID=796027 RepID=A0A167FLY4_9ASCO|nr:mitochondrial 37S ribosomal protein YmS18 [Sugiyamaella lignohabitans]ANB15465.1 mitochondrial 37S ribosomal protein YmS18 [Sugiyamaella lignohabitans]